MHLHDYDGKLDHLAIGNGKIDFHQILHALVRIRYNGSLCLELNPDVVTPEGILQSRTALQKILDDLSSHS
jgi:sugar phosphate isomerase/epimerase